MVLLLEAVDTNGEVVPVSPSAPRLGPWMDFPKSNVTSGRTTTKICAAESPMTPA